MASSGNFPTMNPFIQSGGSDDDKSSGYISNGALKVNVIKQRCGPVATIGIRTSGKYYFEVYVNSFFGGTNVAIVNESWNLDTQPGWQTPSQNTTDYDLCGYYFGNGKLNNAQSAGDGNNFTTYGDALVEGSVLGVAVDVDNGKVWFHKDGTYPNSGNPATGANPARGSGGTITTAMDFTTKTWFVTAGGWGQTTGIITYNFGQDSTFGGEISAGGNQDSNSQGDFKYSVPSGFTCLSSNNIPISADIDPAQTDNDISSKLCGVLKNSATGGDSYTGLGFQPDLVWVKWTGGSQSHGWFDSSRGTSKVLNTNSTASEASSSGLTSFDSDGYTMGQYYNQSGREYMGWCWKANGGTTASNSNGQTTSTVQANQKAGFSIVEYAGSLTGSGTKTIGHGLSKAPELIIIKNPNKTGRWFIQHTGLTSWNYYISFNTNTGETNASGNGSMSDPTNTVFYTNWTEGSNENNYNHIAYCWHSVEGYSKFGSYIGNSNADGPFIYTGFRPQIVIIKGLVTGSGWCLKDDTLDGYNPGTGVIEPNQTSGKYTGGAGVCDILSNGFKIRTDNAFVNSSSYDPYVYMAWGSVPFKYNNSF